MLLFFIIVIGGPILLFCLIVPSNKRYLGQLVNYASSVARAHQVIDVVTNGSWTAGIDPGTRTLVVVGSNGSGHRFTYDHVASVELTPIYGSSDSGTSTTTSNRGSQLVSAGVGAAIAGPVGLLVGGLSGSKTTTHSSVSTARLDSIELKIRLYFDALPIIKIVVYPLDFGRAERLAARLANAIDQRDCIPKLKDKPEILETALLTNEQTQGQKEQVQEEYDLTRQSGWWARTFG